jgi:hypothetical protein
MENNMKFKNLYKRWHRFDAMGKKFIKRFDVDVTPDPLVEPGYTAWVHGTGQLTQEHRANVTNGVRKACLGVPKTEEHRYKMSLAKLGVPKTEEHRANMRRAQQRNREARLEQKTG